VLAAIETSFDDTGIAVIEDAGAIVISMLSSQIELHAPYRGVVPELAARAHVSNLAQMWEQLQTSLPGPLTGIGVTAGPGLPGSLLAGLSFARGAAAAHRIPLYGLNHLEGHIFSPFIPSGDASPALVFPHLALIISGGHTELFLVRGLRAIALLGQTLDDAVGELLDKTSAMLGYGYPGGARLEQIALASGELDGEGRYTGGMHLPVPMRGSGDLNFSYSGLKTAVVKHVRQWEAAGGEFSDKVPTLVACLFSVIADSLWFKLRSALAQHDVTLITVSGGVAINGIIRQRLVAEADRAGVEVRFPALRHCLDNAEMMAWLLHLQLAAGVAEPAIDCRSTWRPGVYLAAA
jgi:N6-L-threonylcarbamoyladenine synthase